MALTVLLGGARSGKSRLALRLAGEIGRPVTFVATAEARDGEMAERIRRHRAQRPAGWTTVEEPRRLGEALDGIDPGRTIIVDCLTLWVSNLIEQGLADQEVHEASAAAASAAAARADEVIVVSNEVGSGIVPMTELGRRYQDLLGEVNSTWVERAARAALLLAGRPLWLPAASDEPP
jgi:adenosylcobinamide kinase/adenosylcobinamide-phosphate guanylyltransferase